MLISQQNKYFLIICFSLIILTTGCVTAVDQTERDFKTIRRDMNSEIVFDFYKEITLDNGQHVYFLSDVQGMIVYYLFDEEEPIAVGYIGNYKEFDDNINIERDVYWSYSQRPNLYSFLAGTIVNKEISKVSVNNLKDEDIQYFDFKGYDIFYSNKKVDMDNKPILINGYSSNNKLIYQNFNPELQID